MANDAVAPPTPKPPVGPDTLKSVTALARFEFEPGKGNEGTKILMVEWQDADRGRQKTGSWQVSWAGKRTVLSADDNPSVNVRRVYFLLPPGSVVPPHVILAYHPPSDSAAPTEPLRMTVNPLPAIFTPELGATVKATGKKGVLHTIWAKKRLQILEKEIQHETEHNFEGIALEMATAEREWIQGTFGLQVKVPSLETSAIPRSPDGPTSPGLQSPRSPGGGRLSEKLRGLSLGTSEKDLTARGNMSTRVLHPLSPEVGDMAYSSFNSFRPGPVAPKSATTRRIVAQGPPESIRKQQEVAENHLGSASKSDSTDDGLFAVALSPRSPDIPKSPFSFSSADVAASKSRGEQS